MKNAMYFKKMQNSRTAFFYAEIKTYIFIDNTMDLIVLHLHSLILILFSALGNNKKNRLLDS